MSLRIKLSARRKRGLLMLLLLTVGGLSACSRAASETPPAESAKRSKTVFTEKLGAYLVYAPLKAGRPSEFALHLTDLEKGTPVPEVEVSMLARSKSTQSGTPLKAKASEVKGVYTAEVSLPKAGEYYIELELKHPKFTGRLTMTDFDVE